MKGLIRKTGMEYSRRKRFCSSTLNNENFLKIFPPQFSSYQKYINPRLMNRNRIRPWAMFFNLEKGIYLWNPSFGKCRHIINQLFNYNPRRVMRDVIDTVETAVTTSYYRHLSCLVRSVYQLPKCFIMVFSLCYFFFTSRGLS